MEPLGDWDHLIHVNICTSFSCLASFWSTRPSLSSLELGVPDIMFKNHLDNIKTNFASVYGYDSLWIEGL